MKKKFKRILSFGFVGLIMTAFLFGLAVFATPNGDSGADVFRQDQDMVAYADSKNEVKTGSATGSISTYSTSNTTISLSGTTSLDSGKQSVDSYTNPYDSQAKATLTITITFSDDLATAINNSRLKATINISGTYRAKAWSATHDSQSKAYCYVSASGGLTLGATYKKNKTSGSADHDDSAADSSFSQTISGTVTNNTVTIKIESYGFAHVDGDSILSKKYADTWAKVAVNSITVSMSANKPTVTFQSADTNKGTVSPTSATPDFNATASSTATPKTGYYFTKWTNSGGSNVSNTLRYTTAVSYTYSGNPTFKANFAAITKTTGTYIYTGDSQGVELSVPSGYTVTNYYRKKGETAWGQTKPADAGTYEHYGELTRNNEVQGTSATTEFTIQKANPKITETIGTVVFGRPISDAKELPADLDAGFLQKLAALTVPMTMRAVNANATSKIVEGDWKWAESDNDKLAQFGSGRYTYIFTPKDQKNFNEATNTVQLNCVSGLMVVLNDGLGNAAGHEAIVSSQSRVSDTDGLAYVDLQITLNGADAEDYFLLGWKRNNQYLPAAYMNGNHCNYPMASRNEADVFAGIEAVVVKINGMEDISRPYDGAAISLNFSFSQNEADVGLGYNNPMYLAGAEGTAFLNSAPVGVGEYRIQMDFYNASLSTSENTVYVHRKTVRATITQNTVAVAVDAAGSAGYNESIGWAREFRLRLTIPGARSGAIEGYQVSVNGGAWTPISANIGTTTGCPVTYVPDVPAGSEVKSLRFRAIHARNGAQDGVVAESASESELKFDNIEPTISVGVATDDGNPYTGDWTNRTVIFTFTLTHGGSGAVIQMAEADGGWTTVAGQWNGGSENPSSGSVTWEFASDFQREGYRFRVLTGTGYFAEDTGVFDVRVDKTAPVVGQVTPSLQDWSDQAITVELLAQENNGFSGITNIRVEKIQYDGALTEYTDWTASADAYYREISLRLADRAVYRVTVSDAAGNERVLDVKEKVDTDLPEVVEVSGYTADSWTNREVFLGIRVNAGGSGMQLYYTETPEATHMESERKLLSAENEWELENPDYALCEGSYLLSLSAEQNSVYKFYAVNRFGKESVFDFGKVKIDTTAPDYLIITNLSQMQGDAAPWRDSAQNCEVRAMDVPSVESGDLAGEIAKTSVSGVKNFGVNNGALAIETTDQGGGVFSFAMDRASAYTIRIEDEAGNVTEYSFSVKIDCSDPAIGTGNDDWSATVGGISYNFRDWVSGRAPLVITMNVSFTASGIRPVYATANGESVIWTAMTNMLTNTDEVSVINGYIYQKGNETQPNQSATLKFEWSRDIQTEVIRFAVETGSGKRVEARKKTADAEDPKLMVDRTAPNVGAWTLSPDTARTQWTAGEVVGKFTASDGASGSGLTAVEIKRFPHDVQDISAAWENSGTLVNFDADPTFSLNTVTMDTYAIYGAKLTDVAGNETYSEGVLVLIDPTKDFILEYSAQISENAAYQNDWLLQGEATLSFRITGISQWGASGGRVESSWDGGATWHAYDDKFSVSGGSGLTPVITLRVDQNRNYRFRAVTGAGIAVYAADEYAFKMDGIAPHVVLSATSGGMSYYGAWTSAPVQISALYTIGASDGMLYYMLTDSTAFPGTGDMTLWTEWAAVTEGTEHISHILNENLTAKYLHAVLISGTGRTGSHVTVPLNVDTVAPTAETVSDYIWGEWTNATVNIALNIESGDSGYSVYYAYAPADGTYGEETALTGNQLQLNASTDGQYRFRIVSGAGLETQTEGMRVRVDKEELRADLIANGENTVSGGETWWISNVDVRLSATANGKSPVKMQVSDADEPGVWSDWRSLEGFDFTVTDHSITGGTEKYYRFRLQNEAGTATEEIYVSGEDGLVRVDTHRYEITVLQILQDMEGVYCGSVSGVGSAFRRGATQEIKVTANSGYWLKRAEMSGFGIDYPAQYGTGTAEDIFSITVEGEDIVVRVWFYVETEITLSGLEQYLKSGAIDNVTANVSENFPLESLQYEILYNGAAEVPQSIGKYPITLTVAQDAVLYSVTDNADALTVRYFPQSGDYMDPYQVDGLEDFPYIDVYLTEGYDWLQVPAQPSFRQTKDIEITQADADTGAYMISEEFGGARYDGNGYRIFATESLRVSAGFALFPSVRSAEIINVGLEISLILSENGEESARIPVSPLIGRVYDSMIAYNYVIADLEVNGSFLNIGAIAGEAMGTMLGYCFADISVQGDLTSCRVGGLVGMMDGGILFSNYILPRFSLSGEDLSVGLVGGYLQGTLSSVEGVEENGKIYYRPYGIGVNNEAVAAKGFGNIADNGLVPFVDFVEHDLGWFLSCEEIIMMTEGGELQNSIGEAHKVSVLTRVKNGMYGVDGEGTVEKPYLIGSVDDLEHLNRMPWAYFLLTADLDLSDYHGRLGEGMPFTGVLDGGNHRLAHYSMTADDGMGGLFRTLAGTVIRLSLIDFDITATGENAVGGILAAMFRGGTLETVTVTGNVTVNGTEVTAGGIVGAAESAGFNDVAAQATVNGAGETVYVGGIAGNARNIIVQNVVSMSTVNANFTKANMAGSAYGVVNNISANDIVYALQSSLYLNEKQATAVYGENAGAAVPVGLYSYNYLLDSMEGLANRLDKVYPFRKGNGTQADPFLIYDYADLLRINDYLYAEFRLANDILIGDWNGDGALTQEDGYTYDFRPIGSGAVFGGVLDGTGEATQNGTRLYRIDGLTDSLFETVTGTVKNLYLNVNYIVVEEKSDTDSMAVKEAAEDENIVYGAVAKYLKGDSATVRTVIVGGDIRINVKGNAKAVVGGVIGESRGGMVLGVISGANITVNAPVAEVGGVAGYVRGASITAKDEAMPSLDINIPVGTVRVNGGSCSVGYLVGRQAGNADVDTSIEYDAEVFINGTKVNVEPVGRR